MSSIGPCEASPFRFELLDGLCDVVAHERDLVVARVRVVGALPGVPRRMDAELARARPEDEPARSRLGMLDAGPAEDVAQKRTRCRRVVRVDQRVNSRDHRGIVGAMPRTMRPCVRSPSSFSSGSCFRPRRSRREGCSTTTSCLAAGRPRSRSRRTIRRRFELYCEFRPRVERSSSSSGVTPRRAGRSSTRRRTHARAPRAHGTAAPRSSRCRRARTPGGSPGAAGWRRTSSSPCAGKPLPGRWVASARCPSPPPRATSPT